MSETGAIYAGKLALVTGSRRGVGRLIAEHILNNGGRVAGFARGASTIDHPDYHHFQVDIGDPASVQQGFAALKKVSDAVHIVVNNAAVLTSQYAMIMPPAAAQAMFNTNLMGAFMVSREASKLMRKGKWGRIINIGSMAVSLEPDRRFRLRRLQGRPGNAGQCHGQGAGAAQHHLQYAVDHGDQDRHAGATAAG
jgi:3-oxoacyl-[acyl-carrier protein] reductase